MFSTKENTFGLPTPMPATVFSKLSRSKNESNSLKIDEIITLFWPVFCCVLPFFCIYLPPATYLPPPRNADIQGILEDWWQSGR